MAKNNFFVVTTKSGQQFRYTASQVFRMQSGGKYVRNGYTHIRVDQKDRNRVPPSALLAKARKEKNTPPADRVHKQVELLWKLDFIVYDRREIRRARNLRKRERSLVARKIAAVRRSVEARNIRQKELREAL